MDNTYELVVGSLGNTIFSVEDDNITFENALSGEIINLDVGLNITVKNIQINKLHGIDASVDVNPNGIFDNMIMEIEPNEAVVEKLDMVSKFGCNNNPRVFPEYGTLLLKNPSLPVMEHFNV